MWNLRRIILCCYLLRFSEEFVQLHVLNDPNFNGHYHIENAVEQTIVESLLDCASLCLHSTRCLSYFYDTLSNECILHAIAFGNTLPSYTDTGWKYYLTEDRSGRCTAVDGFIHYRDLDFCYKIYDALPTNFNEFKEVCRKANAELVRVDTEQKQKYIELIAENLPVTQLCIQGTDTIVHNQWTFDDGTIMTYFKWNKEYNEPGGNQGNIGIQIVYNFTWWDIVGKWPNVPCVFICEQYKIY